MHHQISRNTPQPLEVPTKLATVVCTRNLTIAALQGDDVDSEEGAESTVARVIYGIPSASALEGVRKKRVRFTERWDVLLSRIVVFEYPYTATYREPSKEREAGLKSLIFLTAMLFGQVHWAHVEHNF